MQNELVMVYADGQWEDIYNVASSINFDLNSDEAALNYVKIKYNKRFKGCTYEIINNELYAICPDNLELPTVNTGTVLKPEAK
jgi:hypothetical protein